MQQSVTYSQASAIYNQLMDFKCSWKDANVLIQDSAFIGHSLTEIRAALAALSDSQYSPGTASSSFKALTQDKQVSPTLLQGVVPQVLSRVWTMPAAL